LEIFERVRQSADFIPAWQVEQQMKRELGPNWIKLFRDFNIQPFAAASIGQVLRKFENFRFFKNFFGNFLSF